MEPVTGIYRAIKGSKIFEHFGIHPKTASLYGRQAAEIIEVEVSISDNQEKPKSGKMEAADYWGWWDYKRNEFSLIWPQYFLLNMCFPYGMVPQEERGDGKAYRVNVIEI